MKSKRKEFAEIRKKLFFSFFVFVLQTLFFWLLLKWNFTYSKLFNVFILFKESDYRKKFMFCFIQVELNEKKVYLCDKNLLNMLIKHMVKENTGK